MARSPVNLAAEIGTRPPRTGWPQYPQIRLELRLPGTT